MARPLRLDYAGAVWHLTSRGNARGDIFYNDHDRLDFLELLAEVVRRFQWTVYTDGAATGPSQGSRSRRRGWPPRRCSEALRPGPRRPDNCMSCSCTIGWMAPGRSGRIWSKGSTSA